MTEADFLMGAWRIEMVLDLLDDEQQAREKLETLEQLINDYSIDSSNADQWLLPTQTLLILYYLTMEVIGPLYVYFPT